jgi:S1-C subfamily serine protease
VVTKVKPGSLSYHAGLEPGDLIVSVEDTGVRTVEEYQKALQAHDLADGVRLHVQRGTLRQFVMLEPRALH